MNFPFPFTPYSIQQEFMKELFREVENGKCGIFESPTGTGKSLSICCGILKWLNDHSTAVINDLENEICQIKTEIDSSSDSSDWLQEEYEKIRKNQTLSLLTKKLEKLQSQNEKYKAMKLKVKQMKQNVENKSKTIEFYNHKGKHKENNVELLDKEDGSKESNGEDVDEDFIVADELVVDDDDNELDDGDESEVNVKIFISSRTHSQLSQFIGEIKRTIYKDSTRVVTLASRQHFCINPDVLKLKHINLINERCLDLQKSSKTSSVSEEGKVLKKSKTKSCSGCPYYNQSNITRLKENLLVEILDMEDLVKSAKELKACPYYATRMALEDAQVVLMSHAGIVSAGARSGVSLNLQNNVLILDEAHGLTAALENAHSAPVTGKQLASVKTYLQFYIDKYRARLSSKNLLSLNQISFVVGRFLNLINPKEKTKQKPTTIFTLEDFVIKSEIDHLNLRPLVEFCRNTRLPAKLHGFSMKYNQNFLEEEMRNRVKKRSSFEMFLSSIAKNKADDDKVEGKENVEKSCDTVTQAPSSPSAGSALYALLDFLQRLCDRSEDGRILSQTAQEDTGLLKYLLLNPAQHFGEVVKQCRSVILAGGTMEPISEFQSLLSNRNAMPVEDIAVVRCDHVVPPDNVLAICLNRGPTNVALNFSYENRQSKHLIEEVGRILRNVCSLVPGGVVCFFPSYSYEQIVFEHVTSTGIMDSLKKKKMVFREPKSAADVDQVLSEFAKAVRSKECGTNGALLLSVVGGKLSEGLNFSDELGRCVIVVGMPYPNVKSPELQEKMNYLNKTVGAGAGSVYYENLCMKAVNQCIGRAVRHLNDYACVLLLDERYSRPQTVSALPSFVQKSLKTNSNFGPTIGSIAKFFNSHKEKK